MSFNAIASSLTLTGSALSCLGSGSIILCSLIYHRTQRSFRHALVFNLAVSDFINSLTNCISGSLYIAHHELVAGAACTFNGWIEQLSVQATDFSILAISIATLYVVTRRARLDAIPVAKRVLLCLALWVVPLVSSTTVTALGEMKPVSGNWCWISKTRPDLRYGLAHGWRFAIILVTICIYVYIYQYLSRHFRSLVVPAVFTRQTLVDHRELEQSWPETHSYRIDDSLESGIPLAGRSFLDTSPDPQNDAVPSYGQGKYQPSSVYHPEVSAEVPSTYYHTPRQQKQLPSPALTQQSSSGPFSTASKQNSSTGGGGGDPARRINNGGSETVETEIKRMLLLNGYPIMYILLWIPGLTNRAFEASGRPASSSVLAAMQCSTQFVGFANALTYGFSWEMRQTLGRDFRRLFKRKDVSRLEVVDSRL